MVVKNDAVTRFKGRGRRPLSGDTVARNGCRLKDRMVTGNTQVMPFLRGQAENLLGSGGEEAPVGGGEGLPIDDDIKSAAQEVTHLPRPILRHDEGISCDAWIGALHFPQFRCGVVPVDPIQKNDTRFAVLMRHFHHQMENLTGF